MKDFLAFFGEFIVVIAVSGMMSQLAPDGSQKKYVQFAISLSVLTALLGPMMSVVASLPDTLQNIEWRTEGDLALMEGALSDEVVSVSAENIERSVSALLSQKFGISEELLDVSVVLDDSDRQNIVIRRVEVRADGVSAAKKKEMKTYLQTLLLEQSEIVIMEERGADVSALRWMKEIR